MSGLSCSGLCAAHAANPPWWPSRSHHPPRHSTALPAAAGVRPAVRTLLQVFATQRRGPLGPRQSPCRCCVSKRLVGSLAVLTSTFPMRIAGCCATCTCRSCWTPATSRRRAPSDGSRGALGAPCQPLQTSRPRNALLQTVLHRSKLTISCAHVQNLTLEADPTGLARPRTPACGVPVAVSRQRPHLLRRKEINEQCMGWQVGGGRR